MFVFGCTGSSSLRVGFSLVAACGGSSLVAVRRLLAAVVSLVAEHGLQACRLQELWFPGSRVVTHRLSCSSVCRIFPDQGSDPCPLHW